MKMYLTNGKYWQTLVQPDSFPDAIAIGPYVFVKNDDHYREGTPAGDVYRGTVSYMGEQDIPDLA